MRIPERERSPKLKQDKLFHRSAGNYTYLGSIVLTLLAAILIYTNTQSEREDPALTEL